MSKFNSPLRYPGGKGVLSAFVKAVITGNGLIDGDYVEVYAGGAGIAWDLLFNEYVRHVYINDISVPVFSFWYSVLHYTDDLCQLIKDTPVTIGVWQKQRAIQSDVSSFSILEVGFSTFFLNRTNRSGILTAGMIGGKSQSGNWKMDARFNKVDLIGRIQRIARYKDRVHLFNMDASDFVLKKLNGLTSKALVYLDPPYYVKGQQLYVNHYKPDDHQAVATLVAKNIKLPWIVSYDATPEIMNLYTGFEHIVYGLNYSAQKKYTGNEVMFFSPGMKVPTVENPAQFKA